MGILTFKGGVHPYDGKELSKNSPVVKYLPKGDMVYPLSQHIGAPAAAIVQKGDHVLAGQKIADAAGFVSSPIHSSVSGTVKGIEPRLTATGSMVNSIIIENDQQYESVEFTPARLEDLSKEEILARIKEGGVVGMGGAGFPTQVKLAPKEPEKIDHILVNGAECEPYLTSDYRRMLDDSEKLIEGLRVMLKLFDNAKGYICIEDNKPDCIAKLKEMVKDIPRIEDELTALDALAEKNKFPEDLYQQWLEVLLRPLTTPYDFAENSAHHDGMKLVKKSFKYWDVFKPSPDTLMVNRTISGQYWNLIHLKVNDDLNDVFESLVPSEQLN